MTAKNTFDIVRPFAQQISERLDVQILGGVGTAALEDPRSEIDFYRGEVYTPTDIYQSSLRDDGTLRDIDVLLLSSDPNKVAELEADLEQTVGDDLQREVFPVRPYTIISEQMARPFGGRVLRTFVSDRYDSAPGSDEAYIKALFPFAVPIDPTSLIPWTVITADGTRIPIPNPGTTITNYTNRSISGLRYKDTDKMTRIAHSMLEIAPEMREWIMDGPGASQLELSRLIASLHTPGQANYPLVDGITVNTLTHKQLRDSEHFMVPAMPGLLRYEAVAMAAFKSRRLRWFEKHDWIVTKWHQYGEPRAAAIVKNS